MGLGHYRGGHFFKKIWDTAQIASAPEAAQRVAPGSWEENARRRP